jgi:hypothetical protein
MLYCYLNYLPTHAFMNHEGRVFCYFVSLARDQPY